MKDITVIIQVQYQTSISVPVDTIAQQVQVYPMHALRVHSLLLKVIMNWMTVSTALLVTTVKVRSK